MGKALHGVAERFLTDVRGPDLYPTGWDHDLTPEESKWIRTSAELAIATGVWKRSGGLLVEYPFLAVIGTGPGQMLDGLPRLLPAIAEQRAGSEEGERQVRPVLGVARCMTGFMDGVDFGEGLVLDHKTAKHSGYAKTSKTLAKDEQMLIYAAIVLAQDRDTCRRSGDIERVPVWQEEKEFVTVRHNVFLKNLDPTQPGQEPVYSVEAVIHRAEAVAFWVKVATLSEEMLKVRTVPVGEGLAKADNWEMVQGEANPGVGGGLRAALTASGDEHACSSYGGCLWKDVCWGRCKASQVVAKLLPPTPPPKPTPLIFRPGRYSATPSTENIFRSLPMPFKVTGAKAVPAQPVQEVTSVTTAEAPHVLNGGPPAGTPAPAPYTPPPAPAPYVEPPQMKLMYWTSFKGVVEKHDPHEPGWQTMLDQGAQIMAVGEEVSGWKHPGWYSFAVGSPALAPAPDAAALLTPVQLIGTPPVQVAQATPEPDATRKRLTEQVVAMAHGGPAVAPAAVQALFNTPPGEVPSPKPEPKVEPAKAPAEPITPKRRGRPKKIKPGDPVPGAQAGVVAVAATKATEPIQVVAGLEPVVPVPEQQTLLADSETARQLFGKPAYCPTCGFTHMKTPSGSECRDPFHYTGGDKPPTLSANVAIGPEATAPTVASLEQLPGAVDQSIPPESLSSMRARFPALWNTTYAGLLPSYAGDPVGFLRAVNKLFAEAVKDWEGQP